MKEKKKKKKGGEPEDRKQMASQTGADISPTVGREGGRGDKKERKASL